MEIKTHINHKQHLICISLGVVLGIVLAITLRNYFEFDTVETMMNSFSSLGENLSEKSAADLVYFQREIVLYAPVIFTAGMFNGGYLYAGWLKVNCKRNRLLSVIFFPFTFIVIMFIGILTFIPFFIYNIYGILKKAD